jgi:hypothetical protein
MQYPQTAEFCGRSFDNYDQMMRGARGCEGAETERALVIPQ